MSSMMNGTTNSEQREVTTIVPKADSGILSTSQQLCHGAPQLKCRRTRAALTLPQPACLSRQGPPASPIQVMGYVERLERSYDMLSGPSSSRDDGYLTLVPRVRRCETNQRQIGASINPSFLVQLNPSTWNRRTIRGTITNQVVSNARCNLGLDVAGFSSLHVAECNAPTTRSTAYYHVVTDHSPIFSRM